MTKYPEHYYGRAPLHTLFLMIVAACILADAANYTLAVDAEKRTQHWNRYYETGVATCHMNTVITTYWKRGIANALKIGHAEAGFKYFRGHGILHDDIALVDTNKDGSLKLNWTRFDSVYNLAKAAGLRPIVEISTTPSVLASGNDLIGTSGTVWYGGAGPNRSVPNRGGWGRWVALMDSIVTHCEKKWGVYEVRNNWYFEVWNEPTWWYMGFEKYVELYDYTATGLKNADSLIRVGGPAAEGTNTITGGREFQILLDHCRTGKNAATGKIGTPIDFMTYHWYANNSVPVGITGAVLNAGNLAIMHKAVLDTLRKNYAWFKGPVFIDEVGPTSGTPGSTNAQWDKIRSASQLERLDSTTTSTLIGNTFTKSFTAKYFSVHLIILTNPDATNSKKTSRSGVIGRTERMHVAISSGRVALTTPGLGRYTVTMFTTAGRKVFEQSAYTTGRTLLFSPKTVAGTYLLQCCGPDGLVINRLMALY